MTTMAAPEFYANQKVDLRFAYNLVETIRIIGILLKPYMVEVPDKIFDQIGVNKKLTSWDSAKTFGILENGTKVKKGENLFPRLDTTKEMFKIEKTEDIKNETFNKNEVKEEVIKEENYITIDELDKIKLKVGQILSVERVEKSDKLYKLQVDLGEENPRTIVSGLVPYYKEDELLNKQVVVVANLKPAKLRGVESNGMLLAAGDDDIVKLLVLDNNSGLLENGSNIH